MRRCGTEGDMLRGASERSLNEMCSSRICVDTYREGEWSGRIYNNYYAEAIPFANVMQLLKKMEALLDGFEYPQRTLESRRFGQKAGRPEEELGQNALLQLKPHEACGKAATFHVKVIFRKNASWQGKICWVDGGSEKNFRSALELLMLMDEALANVLDRS